MLVTVLLVAANALAYFLEQASGVQATCERFGLVPAQFMKSGGISPIFTAMFLHANLTHLVGNLVFLAAFGALAERELGSVRFATLYFASGVGGALLHIATDPSATNPMVGCSGAIFGLIATVAALKPRFLGFAIAFGVIEIYHSFSGVATSVSFGDHLGGLAVGALFAGLLRVSGFSGEGATA